MSVSKYFLTFTYLIVAHGYLLAHDADLYTQTWQSLSKKGRYTDPNPSKPQELEGLPKLNYQEVLERAWGPMSLEEVNKHQQKLAQSKLYSDGDFEKKIEMLDIAVATGCLYQRLEDDILEHNGSYPGNALQAQSFEYLWKRSLEKPFALDANLLTQARTCTNLQWQVNSYIRIFRESFDSLTDIYRNGFPTFEKMKDKLRGVFTSARPNNQKVMTGRHLTARQEWGAWGIAGKTHDTVQSSWVQNWFHEKKKVEYASLMTPAFVEGHCINLEQSCSSNGVLGHNKIRISHYCCYQTPIAKAYQLKNPQNNHKNSQGTYTCPGIDVDTIYNPYRVDSQWFGEYLRRIEPRELPQDLEDFLRLIEPEHN